MSKEQIETGVSFDFEAAHILQVDGSSGRIHGHTYSGKIYITGEVDPESGFTDNADFRDLKRNLRELISWHFDHHFLVKEDHPTLPTLPSSKHTLVDVASKIYPGIKLWEREPTTENIARTLAQLFEATVGHTVSRIELNEGPRNHVTITFGE